MSDVNKVIVVGNLTRDSELKNVGSSGTPLLRFSVANNQDVKKGDEWVEQAHFFDAYLWGKRGEALRDKLRKGTRVAIEGTLVQNRWTTEGGDKRSRLEIKVTEINLFGSRGERTTSGEAKPTENEGDDVPF